MYCPRCGQQASDEVRFCSRCGLRLDGVTALLENDGFIWSPAPERQDGELSPCQKGKRLAVKLIFLSIVLLPFAIALSAWGEVDSPAPLIIPLTAFLVGLTKLIYSAIFEDERSPAKQKPQYMQPRAFNQNAALPPPPAPIMASRRVKTADMLQQPSITENTTNLLEDK